MKEEGTDQASVRPVPQAVRRAGKRMLWFGFALPMALYACVVLFAPANVLERSSGARRFADGVREMLMTKSGAFDFHAHAQSTAFPEVAMLASATAVCAVLVMVLAMVAQSMWNFEHLAQGFRRTNRSFKDCLGGLLIFPLFGLFCMWAFFCLKGDPGFAAGLTTQGRVGYLFMSSLAMLICGAGVGLWPMQVRSFWVGGKLG